MTKLKKAFLEFHGANPWVYNRILKHCHALRKKGYKQYSARTLIAVMRFEWDLVSTGEVVETVGGEKKTVKLNDHHSPYYARMIMTNHLEFSKFFETRELMVDDDGKYPPPPGASVNHAALGPLFGGA